MTKCEICNQKGVLFTMDNDMVICTSCRDKYNAEVEMFNTIISKMESKGLSNLDYYGNYHDGSLSFIGTRDGEEVNIKVCHVRHIVFIKNNTTDEWCVI